MRWDQLTSFLESSSCNLVCIDLDKYGNPIDFYFFQLKPDVGDRTDFDALVLDRSTDMSPFTDPWKYSTNSYVFRNHLPDPRTTTARTSTATAPMTNRPISVGLTFVLIVFRLLRRLKTAGPWSLVNEPEAPRDRRAQP